MIFNEIIFLSYESHNYILWENAELLTKAGGTSAFFKGLKLSA
jgi:hypothetical protein